MQWGKTYVGIYDGVLSTENKHGLFGIAGSGHLLIPQGV